MKNIQKWNEKNSFNKSKGAKYPPSYPNEMLVKLCSSKSYSNLTKNLFNKKKINVCEIGCLAGNNLRFFLDRKWNAYGIEINHKLIRLTKKNLNRFGIDIKNINIGNNINIPYKNNFFEK